MWPANSAPHSLVTTDCAQSNTDGGLQPITFSIKHPLYTGRSGDEAVGHTPPLPFPSPPVFFFSIPYALPSFTLPYLFPIPSNSLPPLFSFLFQLGGLWSAVSYATGSGAELRAPTHFDHSESWKRACLGGWGNRDTVRTDRDGLSEEPGSIPGLAGRCRVRIPQRMHAFRLISRAGKRIRRCPL